jgi:hypothetical protein
MFKKVNNEIAMKDIIFATPGFIAEADKLDLDLVFETWYEMVEDGVDQDDFYDEHEKEFTPSVFREMLVDYAKQFMN